MIFAYIAHDAIIERRTIGPDDVLPTSAVWIDLFEPTVEDRARVDAAFNLAIPTHAEMLEIEPSSRLYAENGAVYMTATILARADESNPTADAFTFVLARHSLVTVRYHDPRPVHTYGARIVRQPATCTTGEEALLGLLETFVDRIADILEKAGLDLDAISRGIFGRSTAMTRQTEQEQDMQQVLRQLGRIEDLCSTARESMLGLVRLVRFLDVSIDAEVKKRSKEIGARIKTLNRDLTSLMEHADFDSRKVNFLLDATLGLINIEQNRIIKLFSVVSVVLMPPTLVGTIYGMNFRSMPELDWSFGYPMAIVLMLASAILPYLYFKKRGWF
ncbi:MAG: magnesium transporter CorA family protein [Proteobacteria bacterium]|nr:magnesium transporter CorA family protein [Pseudomonadota bacterium]